MEILYGYLEIGGTGYFQSLNQFNSEDGTRTLISTQQFSISTSASPAISSSILYLNGRSDKQRFNILRYNSNSLNRFLIAIKEHNARLNNV